MTKMIVTSAAILAAVATCSLARPADDPQTGCHHHDKSFLKCFMDSGNSILQMLSTGDKNLHLPVLDPLEVKKINVFDKGEHMHLELMDSIHRGLGKTVITKAQVDPEHFVFKLNMTNPEYSIKGKYNMNAKIGMLPVAGEGDFEITLYNASITWNILGKPEEKNGKHYMNIIDLKATLNPQNMKLHLSNLFNGNEELGENMNKFFNDNWKEVYEQLKPFVEKSYSQLISTVGSQLLQRSSYEDMFPDIQM